MKIDLIIDYQQLAEIITEKLVDKLHPNHPQSTENKVIRGIRELANYLKVSTVTAQRMKNDGTVPFFKIGNRLFFNSLEVNKVIGRIN